MINPKISVIVPVYNVEKYIRRCLDSLLNQVFLYYEIIIINDCSTDSSALICDEYEKKDQRIKVIHKKMNQGLGCARNDGVVASKGEYVVFIDSDDYVDSNMLLILYDTAQSSCADVVFCGYNNVDESGKITKVSEVYSILRYNNESDIGRIILDMIASNPKERRERRYRASVWHGIYKNNIIKSNDIIFISEREVLSEDIFFHVDYLSAAKVVVFIPDALYYYCYNQLSLTKTFVTDKFLRMKRMRRILRSKLCEKGYDELCCSDRVDKMFIGYVRGHISSVVTSNNSWKDKVRLLFEICNDKVWEEFSFYPYKEMPIIHRYFYLMIIKKKYKSLYFYAIIYQLGKKMRDIIHMVRTNA